MVAAHNRIRVPFFFMPFTAATAVTPDDASGVSTAVESDMLLYCANPGDAWGDLDLAGERKVQPISIAKRTRPR